MAERNLAIRLSVMDGGKVKAELREIGESGEKSLQRIELAGKPASKGLLALNAAANDVKAGAIGLSSQIGPMGSALAALGPAGLAAAAGIGAIAIVLKKSFDEAAAAEQAQNRLQGVLKATGYASGLTGQEIADMAEEMEVSTLTTAEAVKEASAVMATFRSVSGDTFKQSIHLAQDMAAVFGQDLRSSATQLGKALEDPINGITALKRVGVSFSDTQKDLIAKLVETGQKADAQRLILAALEKQVGGAGQAEAQGLTGAAHRLSVAWGDMLKAIGQTETVGGTAQSFLNSLASTFRTTIEWVSDAPLSIQLRDAKNELDEVEKKLEKIKDIPFILQPRGNVDKHVKKAEELRQKIEAVTKAIKAQEDEQKRADEGQKAAEQEGISDLISQKAKGFDEVINKLLEKDPAQQIAKINEQLKQSVAFMENLRNAGNGTQIDEAIEKAKKAASIQITDIQNPIAEAAQKESAANQKIIDDLKRQLLGLGNERQAFIDQAVSRLSEKATDGMRGETTKLAAQFFDEQAFEKAQKVVDDLNDKMKALGLTARQLFVKEAVDVLPDAASEKRIEQVRKLAEAYYDQRTAKEKLDKLKEEGKQITEGARGAEEAYADQIQRLTEMLNAGAISQDIFNKSKDKAGDDLLSKRTDPEAGILRAFKNYEKGAGDTATAIEQAFTAAMKATEDAIVNMVTSGEVSLNSLNDLANSIVADITRMVVQQSITGPLAKMIGGSMESGGFLDSVFSSIFHEGGTAGEPAPSRQVPAFVFAGAPRYHGGGIAGLKPNEVPAILERGEEVLSKNSRRSSPINLVMNISTPDANSFRASQAQVSAEAARGINRARRNL